MAKGAATDAEGREFNSQVGRIRRRGANGSPPLQRFFGFELTMHWAAEMGPALVKCCVTASVMKMYEIKTRRLILWSDIG